MSKILRGKRMRVIMLSVSPSRMQVNSNVCNNVSNNSRSDGGNGNSKRLLVEHKRMNETAITLAQRGDLWLSSKRRVAIWHRCTDRHF